MRAYPRYRDSGVEWLGEVPEHWGAARVTDMFEARSGGTPSTAEEAYWEGDTPWVSAKDMKSLRIRDTEDHISDEAVRVSATSLVPRGTVLLVARSGILKHTLPVGLSEREVAINQDIKGLIPREALVEPLYFVFCLNGFQSILLTLWRQQGATVESLDFDTVRSTRLPLPPLDEQRAIAAYLDRETERIDALVAKKRLLIERLDEYRTALITRTVTRGLPPEAARAAGLDPSPRLKPSGVEWLGEVPEHWEVSRLKWSAAGTVNGVWGDEPDGENDIACVRVADFDRRGFRVHFGEPTMRAVTRSQRSGRELLPGDLLLEKSGGGEKQMVGCVVFFDHAEPAVTSNFIARVSPVGSPRFWTYMHAALYSGKLNYPAIKQTTGIQNLDANAYFDTLTVFPPLAEQEAIAAFLDQETARIDRLASQVERAIERSQEYRTALVTAAVTGKIDVRE